MFILAARKVEVILSTSTFATRLEDEIMKKLVTLLSLALLLTLPIVAASQTAEQVKEHIRKASKVDGNFDEGEIEVQSRKCRPQDFPPQNREGIYKDYRTNAGHDPQVSNPDSQGWFSVSIPYSCRIRTRIVSGCGGIQLSTNDSHPSGAITLRATLPRFSNKLSVDTGSVTGLLERCGLTLSQRAVSQINDFTVPVSVTAR